MKSFSPTAAGRLLLGVVALAACGHDAGPPDGPPPAAEAGTTDARPDAAAERTDPADGSSPDGTACAVTEPRSRWARWPMPHPAGSGYPNPPSYDLQSPDVVVDRVTGLMWERAVDAGTYRWPEATARCACLSLGGYDDWRLPTRIELVSIVDFTRSAPAIDPVAFPGTPVEWFWTSSRWAEDPAGYAWYLYFETGFSNFGEQEARYRVRCVRDPGGGPADGEHYQLDGETVRDQATGLTWQRAVDGTARTQADAKTACAALPLAGGGWRLPSMKELQTLVDEDRASPAIDPLFPDVPLEPFWTGTAVTGIPGSAWRVSFVHGYTYDARDFYLYLTRCVR